MKKLFILTLLGLGLCAMAADYEFTMQEKPAPAETTAVAELKKALNFELRIDGKKPIFVIGSAAGWKLDGEQWRIKSEGGKIILAGGSPRATLYAVSVFMEKMLGVRCWNQFEELIPQYPQGLDLQPFDISGKPYFIQRDIYADFALPADGGRFAVFNRLNSIGDKPIGVEYGGNFAFGRPYFVHTFNHYFPEKDYFEKHPEYFALVGGKRLAGPQSQLCLTNAAMTAEMWEKLKAYILQDEAAAATGVEAPLVYDISANDNNRICGCEPCRSIIKKEGDDAGLILYFVNQLAAKLKEFRPGLYMSTLAYMNTEKAPDHIRPLDNVVIRLCDTSSSNFSSIQAPENKVFRDKLLGWSAAGAHLYIWKYAITYDVADLPYPSEFTYPDQFRFYRDHKVKFMFMEHEKPERADMHTMKSWLEAKFLENPDADFEQLFTDFLNSYYGAGGKFIGEYRRLLWASVKKYNSMACAYIPNVGAFNFLDLKTVSRSQELFDLAENAVKDDPVLLRRVRRERLNLDKAVYVRIRELSREWRQSGRSMAEFPFSLPDTIKRARETWTAAIDFNYGGLPYRGGALDQMKKELDLYAKLPMTVPGSDQFKDGIEFTVEQGNPNGRQIVLDPESPIGYAAMVDLSDGLGIHRLPLLMGAYVASTKANPYGKVLAAAQVKGPGYNWYSTPEFAPEPSGYIYFLNDWTIQFTQDVAASKADGRKYKAWVSIKFTGPDFPHSRPGEKNAIYIDRCVMVPVN